MKFTDVLKINTKTFIFEFSISLFAGIVLYFNNTYPFNIASLIVFICIPIVGYLLGSWILYEELRQ